MLRKSALHSSISTRMASSTAISSLTTSCSRSMDTSRLAIMDCAKRKCGTAPQQVLFAARPSLWLQRYVLLDIFPKQATNAPRFCSTRNMAVLSTGGRLASSFTRCSSSNHPSAVRTKMKSTTPSWQTSLFTPSTCRETRSPSSKSCLRASRSCVSDPVLPMPRRS